MSLLDAIAPVPTPRRGEGRPSRYPKGIVSGSSLANWYGSKYQLINWAKREGWEGGVAGKTYEEIFDRDMDIGSLVHAMIENSVHGTPLPEIPEDYAEPVASAFTAWQDWAEKNNMTILSTEESFVSQEHGLGGTIDAILRDGKGNLVIGDWKTSAQLRSSYLVQLAVYGIAWDANNEEKVKGYHLLRFSKEGARSAELYFPELELEREFALMLRACYTKAAEVKKKSGMAY